MCPERNTKLPVTAEMEDVSRGNPGGKTNPFIKSPHLKPCLLGFQRSQIESQLNGAEN